MLQNNNKRRRSDIANVRALMGTTNEILQKKEEATLAENKA